MGQHFFKQSIVLCTCDHPFVFEVIKPIGDACAYMICILNVIKENLIAEVFEAHWLHDQNLQWNHKVKHSFQEKSDHAGLKSCNDCDILPKCNGGWSLNPNFLKSQAQKCIIDQSGARIIERYFQNELQQDVKQQVRHQPVLQNVSLRCWAACVFKETSVVVD